MKNRNTFTHSDVVALVRAKDENIDPLALFPDHDPDAVTAKMVELGLAAKPEKPGLSADDRAELAKNAETIVTEIGKRFGDDKQAALRFIVAEFSKHVVRKPRAAKVAE